MAEPKSPEDVFKTTSPEVKTLVNEILTVEKEYQHFQNLSSLSAKEKEVTDRIIRIIEKSVKR